MISNEPPRGPEELWKHFSGTYFALRWGLVILALSMPFVLSLYGCYRHELPLQPSMSAYFWAATKEHCASFPMRTIFVGFLFAIGVGLLLYKGLTKFENRLLNGAAFCAAVVAIVPERLSIEENKELFKSCPAIEEWSKQAFLMPVLEMFGINPSFIHFGAAILLFVLLAHVALACANNSLKFFPIDRDPVWYRRIYIGIGIGMIVFPALAWLLGPLLGYDKYRVFLVEAAGVVTFGLYWLVKSVELWISGLERDPVEAVRRAGSPPP